MALQPLAKVVQLIITQKMDAVTLQIIFPSIPIQGLYHAPVIPAGIQSFLWNPVESGRIIFGRESCQNCHSGDHLFWWNRAILELAPEWSWNGLERNLAECCFFFFFCMYDKVSIILTPLGDVHTSSGMFLSHKGVHRAQKWR